MIKKLLNKILVTFSYEHDRKIIEEYLSHSHDTYDLEARQKELEKNGVYNRFYI